MIICLVNLIDVDEIEIPPQFQIDHPVLNYQQITKNGANDTPEELILKIRKVYFAMIATLDDMLGKLFAAIEKMGLKESTYIIFTSDHGEMAMEHGQVVCCALYFKADKDIIELEGGNI